MNWITKGLVFASLCGCSLSSVAGNICPSTNFIANVEFIRAEGAQGIWDLLPSDFIFGERKWRLIFTVYLPEATSLEEALKQGEEYFKTQITFFDPPIGQNSENKYTCYYAQKESTYFVRAISYN